MSLRLRLMLLMLLPTIPLALVQLHNVRELRDERSADLRRTAQSSADLMSGELGQIVDGVERMLVAVADAPWTTGRGFEGCARYFESLQRRFPLISSIGIADATGEVRCLNEPFRPGLSLADRRHFHVAMDHPGLATGRYMVGKQTGNPALAFALRLPRAPDGAAQGVAFASIRLDRLADLLRKRTLTPGAAVLIADADGTVLVSQADDAAVGRPLADDLRPAMAAAASGTLDRLGSDGQPAKVVAYVPPNVPPEGLMLAVEVDARPALDAIDRASRRALTTTALALLGGLTLTLLFSRTTIERPIGALLDAIARWRGGDLTRPSDLGEVPDEIGRIGRAFDELVAGLRERDAERDRIAGELVVSRDEALRASASKSRFLAAASHDLRQPLHALALTVALLAARHRDDGDTAQIAKLRRAIDQLGAMLDSLLDLAELESGDVQPRRTDLALRPMLAGLADEFAPVARERQVGLGLSCDADLTVHSDPHMLERMLRNLVGNALKFTPAGGRVDLEATAEGGAVDLAVRDTGIGIPADQHAEVFEAFRQLGNPERDRRKGVGLGLTIVSMMSGLLSHPVTLASAPGRGATFTIRVPRADRPGGRGPGAEPSPPTDAARPLTVMLVEDDEPVAEATARLFEDWGARVVVAPSAEQAEALLASTLASIDLLVADYRLPGRSGLALLRDVRTRRPDLPVALVTGETASAIEAEAGDAPPPPILRKPVREADLLALLHGANAGSAGSGTIAPCPPNSNCACAATTSRSTSS